MTSDESVEVDREHLAELGRFARACGAIELDAQWITGALITDNPFVREVVIRGQQFSRNVRLTRDLIPLLIGGSMNDQLRADLEVWLTDATVVMEKRNLYLHGYWIGGSKDVDAMVLRRDRQFQAVPVPELRAAADRADLAALDGAEIYWRLAPALGQAPLS